MSTLAGELAWRQTRVAPCRRQHNPTAFGRKRQGRRRCRAAGASSNGSSSGGDGNDGKPLAPWSLTFDLRERDTLWTEDNQARLVRIVAGYHLHLDVGQVEQRLADMHTLLPHLAARVAHIKPSTLAGLLRQPGALVPRLIHLRHLLPSADISAMAAAEPELLLLREVGRVEADLGRLRRLLLGASVADPDAVLQRYPRFMDADLVCEVVAELGRLMPGGDPVATLLADPSWLLRVERGAKRLGDNPDT